MVEKYEVIHNFAAIPISLLTFSQHDLHIIPLEYGIKWLKNTWILVKNYLCQLLDAVN